MTPLDTQSMTPLYQQVAQQLEQAVNSGELRYGDKIMSESEMSQHYGVSRVTVRRAVDRLVESGVLSRRQGKGTYVSFPAFMEDIVVKEHSFLSKQEPASQYKSGIKLRGDGARRTDAQAAASRPHTDGTSCTHPLCGWCAGNL